MVPVIITALCVLLLIAVSACNDTHDSASNALERPAGFTDNQWLGKQLFFDTNLSGPAGQACAACHASQVGWTGPEYAANMTSEVGNLGLTPEEEGAIVAFLKTLTDTKSP
ncbi:MAG: cytochrome-c peroxidase [Thermoanaerobaculales bacterium]|nr:cytochrome-c peroxidase [Thermoanaerobaculales bacterium]